VRSSTLAPGHNTVAHTRTVLAVTDRTANAYQARNESPALSDLDAAEVVNGLLTKLPAGT
jgi:hypothetical protein